MGKKREFAPIKASWPDPTKVPCKGCLHRDKTVIEIDGKEIKCGITRSFCDMYPGPPIDNGKPGEILFENADCDFYEEE